MIEIPHFIPGVGLDRAAHEAGLERGVYYAQAGFMDPRAYTLDPYMFYKRYRASSPLRSRAYSARAAFAGSMLLASYTSVLAGVTSYLGMDPMNVTPGYGHSPVDGRMTVDGVSYSFGEYVALGLDTSDYYM